MAIFNYDKRPVIAVPGSAGECVRGWEPIASQLRAALANSGDSRRVLVVECYPGVHEDDIIKALTEKLQPVLVLAARDAMLRPHEVDDLVRPFLGGDDPVFGFMGPLELPQWFDPARVSELRRRVADQSTGLVLVIGCGAMHLVTGDLLVYANLTRWEAQNRFRRCESSNLGIENQATSAHLQYKRAFFIDWRVADRWKRRSIEQWDYVIDGNCRDDYKMASGDAVRRALRHVTTRPFRVVPFFDPAPWGGEWMKEICDLDRQAINYGWCFDCVPEENSLLLGIGAETLEIPASDLVFYQPRALLGEAVHARFGDEFPIRFDLLDTMRGGNLSFQVHPLTEYIQQKFGMHYTQDESYYILDAKPGSTLYLGLREDVDRQRMESELRQAEGGVKPFCPEQYANRLAAKKHDHFLIPAGTCHCSGADTMVLEISATPYIFTFKMWDWGRLGLDGCPRPIHLDHALANVQWDRTTRYVMQELVNCLAEVASGDGWREERTGLHEREFIETRRHWFTNAVPHDTCGTVNILNLVEGDSVVVESVDGCFDPMVVHYAETFIVPANVGKYVVRPQYYPVDRTYATIKAYVRH